MFFPGILFFCLFGAGSIVGFVFALILRAQKKYSETVIGHFVDTSRSSGNYKRVETEINGVYITTGGRIGNDCADTLSNRYLTYEYIVDGITYTKTTNYSVGGLQAKNAIGKEIEVRYLPDNPEKSSVVNKKVCKIVALSTLIPCVPLCIAGLVMMLMDL